jgi:hypothetical protein
VLELRSAHVCFDTQPMFAELWSAGFLGTALESALGLSGGSCHQALPAAHYIDLEHGIQTGHNAGTIALCGDMLTRHLLVSSQRMHAHRNFSGAFGFHTSGWVLRKLALQRCSMPGRGGIVVMEGLDTECACTRWGGELPMSCMSSSSMVMLHATRQSSWGCCLFL